MSFAKHRADVKEIADAIEQDEANADRLAPLDESQKPAKRKRAGEILNSSSRRRKASDAREDTIHGKHAKAEPAVPMEETGGSEVTVDTLARMRIVAELLADLFECIFDSKWEVRHGALLSLRQVFLASHFIQSLEATGVSISGDGGASDYLEKWLEECLVRCICVLALDQFVDYSADGSVSPVREICAQVFGILLGSLRSESLLVEYLQILRTLFKGSTWHACHGGLLGLKYLVQAHKSHAEMLIPLFFEDVLEAFELRQGEEEVVVLAAEMFEDFTVYLEHTPHEKVQKTAKLLWEALAERANAGLVPACTVRALSAWYNHQPLRSTLERDGGFAVWTWSNLHHVVPLIHQQIRPVRLSAVVCAGAMFQSGSSSLDSSAAVEFVRYLLPHLLLQLLQEHDDEVRANLIQVWKSVIACCSTLGVLMSAVSDDLTNWTDLLWSTVGITHLDVDYKHGAIREVGRLARVGTAVAAANGEENSASRVCYADAIGYLGAHIPLHSSSIGALAQKLNESMQSVSGERQCGALLAISRWAFYEKNGKPHDIASRLQHLQKALGSALESLSRHDWMIPFQRVPEAASPVFYSEQVGLLKRIRIMEARIIDIFAASGITCQPIHHPDSSSAAGLSREIAEHVASFPYDKLSSQAKEFELAHFKRQDLFLVDELIQQSFSRFYHRVQGLGSCAFCNLLTIPTKKSGFLVKALMDSIKQEENADFQRLSAQTVASFVVSQAHVQRKCVAKIVSNLCNSAAALAFSTNDMEPQDPADNTTRTDATSSEIMRKATVRVDGAENALRAICEVAGEDVFATCPSLDDMIAKAWKSPQHEDQIVQQSMHLVRTLAPSIHATAFAKCLEWLRQLTTLVMQPFQLSNSRLAVADAIASICCHAKAHQETAMLIIFRHAFVVFSGDSCALENEHEALLGGILVLNRIVNALRSDLTPYIPSLVHFSMKTMSSQNIEIRSLAARAFADLVPLIPLQMDLEVSSGSSGERQGGVVSGSLREIVGQNQVSREFLENLLEGKAVKHVGVAPFLADGVALRSYQQHGVDWMSFLVENNLHGVLADDMGLGKTLQTLVTIAASLRNEERRSKRSESSPTCAICLIVCPPVVTHHWIAEAEKCLPGMFQSIIDYSVSSAERRALRGDMKASGSTSSAGAILVVTTYSVLRTDVEFLKQMEYSFVVLDEAHLIRNPATSLFSAVQQLRASHRLALSGTPLQNNVADLWSLFEFLMPGYLGDFSLFRKEYVLPISKSRERNATPKHKETAALAVTRLHQKVLPFILRRTKSQVLQELPPKIITNVMTAMTPLQKKLYALATTTSSSSAPQEDLASAAAKDTPLASVLTNLHLLRKICVHPGLVASDSISRNVNAKEEKLLTEWNSSGKMIGLHDLLVESCNIGRQSDEAGRSGGGEEFSVSQHRCLIFGHLKETLDLIEQMLKKVLPRVTYRRLDGRTPLSRRAEIVQQFNGDPSIDLLLLTTAVGGLGLTLTGADTVIFMEHSWNPFVDLQAMDRAHRIGQRRTVRVFRLIVKESLEEHIMDLQAFKERVAATVVAENDAQTSMNANTKEVLSLLQRSSSIVKTQDAAAMVRSAKKGNDSNEASRGTTFLPQGAQELLGQLGDLWDESQYDSLSFPDMDDANAPTDST